MNRRATLKRFFGQSTSTTQLNRSPFSLYAGEWSMSQAAHLLRRTTFGPTYEQIKTAYTEGLEATIAKLFAPQANPTPPIYIDFSDDPEVASGETWVNTIENPDINNLRAKRRQSLFAWTIKNAYESGKRVTIQEKLVLFWHNHFVVSNPNKARRYYQYFEVLRANALGNFKTFVEKITVDSAMLRFLNGQQNTKAAPNENYARELLELFTIGKGPTVGPGDYTHYTEQDVVEIARALTGWRYNNIKGEDANITYFQRSRHDLADKQLSHRFDNVIIPNGDEEEYKQVIDIIFKKEEVARFISRKLYNWFLTSEITDEVETNIIEPMAEMIRSNNYEIQPALMALLSSEHFFEKTYNGCMINHPLDFFFKLINTFEVAMPTDLEKQYAGFLKFYRDLAPLEMNILFHPTVAGWKAFYQAPQYTKIWINSVSLPLRQKLSDKFIKGFNFMGHKFKLDVLKFAASMDNATDPNDLIQNMTLVLFAQPITEEQLVALKEVLIPGLPDFEWTVEYGDYLAGEASLESSVESKLERLIGTMLKMPEFYLI